MREHRATERAAAAPGSAWHAALLADPRGRLTLANLRDDPAGLPLPPWLDRELAAMPAGGSVAAARVALRHALDRRHEGQPDASLYFRGPSRRAGVDLAHVLPARMYLEATAAHRPATSLPRATPAAIEFWFGAGGLDRYLPGERFLNGDPIVWVTPYDGLIQAIASSPLSPADTARNRLGLSSTADTLVLLRYPRAVSAGLDLYRPTFFDSRGWHLWSPVADAGAAWGMTADHVGGAGGLPEAVHGPLMVTSEFETRLLGRTTPFRVDFAATAAARLAPGPPPADTGHDDADDLFTRLPVAGIAEWLRHYLATGDAGAVEVDLTLPPAEGLFGPYGRLAPPARARLRRATRALLRQTLAAAAPSGLDALLYLVGYLPVRAALADLLPVAAGGAWKGVPAAGGIDLHAELLRTVIAVDRDGAALAIYRRDLDDPRYAGICFRAIAGRDPAAAPDAVERVRALAARYPERIDVRAVLGPYVDAGPRRTNGG
jgi:hypothetical protein